METVAHCFGISKNQDMTANLGAFEFLDCAVHCFTLMVVSKTKL